jgi:hypothetical protein
MGHRSYPAPAVEPATTGTLTATAQLKGRACAMTGRIGQPRQPFKRPDGADGAPSVE